MAVERSIVGWVILIVEDDPAIAEGLAYGLEDEGAVVLGPVMTASDGIALARSTERIDAAILDVNLNGEDCFAIADALAARSVPFVFATGYDDTIIPERFHAIVRCEKPFGTKAIVAALMGTV